MNESDCAALLTRTDFSDYVSLARNLTGGDFSLVKQCRKEVCGALWGSGNPDISGIGMAIGYLLESIIFAILSSVYCALRTRSPERQHTKMARLLLSIASKTFYDNAVFFSLAVQLASIFTLVQANYGIKAEGMGAITMKISWLVSTLTLLPLLPLLLMPPVFSKGKQTAAHVNEPARAMGYTQPRVIENPTESVHSIAKARNGQRFLLFAICWALSFYPFYSRMAGTFGKSQIGDSSDSAISTIDWNQIQNACFEGIVPINARQELIITSFGIGSWLLITIIALYKIILSGMKGSHENQWRWLKDRSLTLDSDTTAVGFRIWLLICTLAAMFLIAEFWAFFRLQRFQADMTKAAGGTFADGQWTFGQIVAVVLFIPVPIELLFVWSKRSLYVW